MEILNQIGFSYGVSVNQSNLFTSSHRRYSVGLVFNGEVLSIDYQCNKKSVPTIGDVMVAIIADADCIRESADAVDMYLNLGLSIKYEEDYLKAKQIYADCKKEEEWIDSVFDEEEYQMLLSDLKEEGLW